MIHELKILRQHYERVVSGTKTFEIRLNDMAFQRGDEVILKEFLPEVIGDVTKTTYPAMFTGKQIQFKIGDVYPIDSERVVFSLLDMSK